MVKPENLRRELGKSKDVMQGSLALTARKCGYPRTVPSKSWWNYTILFATLLLLGKALSNIKQTPDGYVVYCKVSRQMYRETGTSECDSESFIDYLRVIEGNRVTFVLKELSDGKTRVNLRSKNDYDVQKVAAEFGGGHRNAAGCTINTGLEESERLILAEIKKILSIKT